eukprot:4729044-Pleurochrysis_carterae.AAC.8
MEARADLVARADEGERAQQLRRHLPQPRARTHHHSKRRTRTAWAVKAYIVFVYHSQAEKYRQDPDALGPYHQRTKLVWHPQFDSPNAAGRAVPETASPAARRQAAAPGPPRRGLRARCARAGVSALSVDRLTGGGTGGVGRGGKACAVGKSVRRWRHAQGIHRHTAAKDSASACESARYVWRI